MSSLLCLTTSDCPAPAKCPPPGDPPLEVSATQVQDAAGGELERTSLALASGFTLHGSLPPPDKPACFQDGRGELKALIPGYWPTPRRKGMCRESCLPSPSTADGPALRICSLGPQPRLLCPQRKFSRGGRDPLADLLWAGPQGVTDLLGCSVLEEKELKPSP